MSRVSGVLLVFTCLLSLVAAAMAGEIHQEARKGDLSASLR